MPPEPLDAAEDLPKEALCQVAFGQCEPYNYLGFG